MREGLSGTNTRARQTLNLWRRGSVTAVFLLALLASGCMDSQSNGPVRAYPGHPIVVVAAGQRRTLSATRARTGAVVACAEQGQKIEKRIPPARPGRIIATGIDVPTSEGRLDLRLERWPNGTLFVTCSYQL